MTIAMEGKGLVIRFGSTPSLVGDLIHWQHDSFHFGLRHDGSIERLRLVPGSPAVDFSFDFQDLDLRPVSRDSTATP